MDSNRSKYRPEALPRISSTTGKTNGNHEAHDFANALCEKFRLNLPRLMRERKISRYALACKAEVARQVVHNTLDGETTPGLHVVARMCFGLGLKFAQMAVEIEG